MTMLDVYYWRYRTHLRNNVVTKKYFIKYVTIQEILLCLLIMHKYWNTIQQISPVNFLSQLTSEIKCNYVTGKFPFLNRSIPSCSKPRKGFTLLDIHILLGTSFFHIHFFFGFKNIPLVPNSLDESVILIISIHLPPSTGDHFISKNIKFPFLFYV